MAAFNWPLSLPQEPDIGQGGWLEVPGDGALRPPTDIGGNKSRQRVSFVESTVVVQFTGLTRAETVTLVDFWRTTLQNGALAFDFTDPLTETVKEYKFAGPPRPYPVGGNLYWDCQMDWIGVSA